jgi:DNA-3-methyladenine glycosylase
VLVDRTALPRSFFARPTLDVARDLLGHALVRETEAGAVLSGIIVETEAYHGPDDRASHASRGLTPRTRVMFGPPGHAYIYLIYGMHNCLNIVTEPEGYPAAVLIRALEPLGPLPSATNGPGRLCRALGIDRSLDGADLTAPGPLYVAAERSLTPAEIVQTPRIGVDYAGEWAARPWRFLVAGNPHVSRTPRQRA